MSDDTVHTVQKRLEDEIEMSTRMVGKDAFSIVSYKLLPRWYLGLGTCALVQGDVATARSRFSAGALYGRLLLRAYRTRWDELDQSRYHAAPVHSGRGVYTAFLSGDPRLITAIDKDLQALNDQVDLAHWDTITRYLEIDLLLLLYRGDDDAAERRVDRLAEEIDQDVAYDTMRQRIHEALVDRDASATETALQEFADSYRDIVEKSGSYWRRLMFHEAATYHLLARHLGLDISVDSDEIPDGIGSYELGDRIDLPRPEHVPEDLIPDA